MPYFITDRHPDCSTWALVKEDGEFIFCHPNKQAATNHMVAISLEEDIEPAGEYQGQSFRSIDFRNDPRQPAIILDIDNTLIRDGVFQKSVYDYALTFENTVIFIVTARPETQREATEQELDGFGIDYAELFMKPQADTDSTEYKTQTASQLLQMHNVMVAIDDSTPIRNAYAGLGILAIHPDQTPKAVAQSPAGRSFRAVLPGDKFTTEAEALARAEQLGCEGTHTMDENGQTIFMPCSTHGRYEQLTGTTDGGYRDEPTGASTPAPKEDQIQGSDKNEPGSAAGAGGDIELDENTETALRNKVKAHNEQMEEESKPAHTRTTYGQLAAVYRRGAGAFSASHRPGMSRGQWAMARVNAFLYLLRNGRPESAAYITDNDLLPEDHPKSTRSLNEVRDVNLTPPAYMRAAARQGLKYYEEGKGGDGLTDGTIREARAMAQGNVTADKWTRIAAWIARHMVDLDAPAANPSHPDYPSAGVVGHLLWGSGPSKRAASRVMDYAQGVVGRIAEENEGRAKGDALSKIETRTNATEFEVREDGNGMTFTGYAAIFDSASEPLPFIERIQRGAFRGSLRLRNDIKFLWNHDAGEILGSTRAKTVKLYEDERGLRVEGTLPNTQRGRDTAELIRRGDIDSLSFGFSVPTGGDTWNAEGTERTLKKVRLLEVSLVAWPAYTATAGTASVRGLDKVAKRTGVDADALADALLKLEDGQTITTDEKEMLSRVIGELAPDEQALEPKGDLSLLALKKKKLELILKGI